MPEYLIESRTRDGAYLVTLPARNLQFEVMLNKPGGFRFELPLVHDSVQRSTLREGLHEAWIYRDGVLVRCGPIWNVNVSRRDNNIKIDGESLESYLDLRRIDADVTYTTLDQSLIAWDMINDSQNQTGGGLGITQGLLETGVSRSLGFKRHEGKTVYDAISDMAEMDTGFDWWITPGRAFTTFYPRLQRNVGLRLEYPGIVHTYGVQFMGKWLRNDILMQGPEQTYAVAVDTTSRSTYGLRQLTTAAKDVKTTNELTALVAHERDLRAAGKAIPHVSLMPSVLNPFDTGQMRLGDLCHIVISDGYVQLNDLHRIVGFQVTVGKQGNESLLLYLEDLREIE